MAIISFHSLEDRIVKKAFSQLAAAQKVQRHLKTEFAWADKSLPSSSSLKTKLSQDLQALYNKPSSASLKTKATKLHVWTKKAIRPSLKERKQNPRSRSAKLRIFQKAL